MSTFARARRSPQRSIIGLIVALASAPLASAGVIDYGPTLHDNGGSGYGPLLGYTGTFDVPQFDDLGGTRPLTQVSLLVVLESFYGKHEFDNEAAGGGTVTLAIGSWVRVQGPLPSSGSRLIVIADAVESVTGAVTGDTDAAADFLGTDSISIVGTYSDDAKSAAKTAADDLAPYIGGGLVTFSFDGGRSTTGTVLTSGGVERLDWPGFTTPPLHNFMFETSVTYTYAPEPAALSLMALGLGSLFARMRRSNR
jgi:hypothetical protein